MKVAVTDCDFSDQSVERGVLGPEVEVVAAESGDPDQIVEAGADADGLLVQYAIIDESLMRRLPRLKVIVRYGIGLDNVDVAAANDLGIEVSNVPDYCVDEVAEHALAMILQVSRRLVAYSHGAADGWTAAGVTTPSRLRDQTVGIVGMGRMGRRLARFTDSLGFGVAYHDPYVTDLEGWGASIPIPELADRADHLSLHVPLTQDTKGMVDRELLRRLGPSGHLINTGRGGLVDESSLLEALEGGELGWASLDVLATEPPTGVSTELLQHPRTLVTPHVAYLSAASLAALPRRAAEIMRDMLLSARPAN